LDSEDRHVFAFHLRLRELRRALKALARGDEGLRSLSLRANRQHVHPERLALGEPLAVEGRVIGADRCQPLGGALIEMWQANAAGHYDIARRGQDDTPYHLRVLLQAGSGGSYAFDTIVPG
jgi:protocatechuate 3,4-dioxygenase beta subunit